MKYDMECGMCGGGPIYQDRDDTQSGCAHCDDCGNTLSPDEFIIYKNQAALTAALRALCFTCDYVGPETLPAKEGWEWFSAGKLICEVLPEDNKWVQEFNKRADTTCAKLLEARVHELENASDKERADDAVLDVQRIQRIALYAVQCKNCTKKQDALWQILDTFNCGPDDVTNAEPPSYYKK